MGQNSLATAVRGQARNLLSSLIVVVLAAELMLYGGDRREVALAFVVIQALGLAFLLGLTRWGPAELRHRPGLWPFYLLAAALAGWIGVQFAAFGSGMARDAWSALDAPPAITIDRFATGVEAAKLAGLAAIFLFGFVVGAGERRSRTAFASLGVLGALYAGWALGGFYAGGWGGVVIRDGRLAASLLSPNTTAAAFGVFATVGWAGALVGLRTALSAEGGGKLRNAAGRSWPWLALSALSLWALVLTASRGGILAVLAGFAVASLGATVARSRRGARVAEVVAATTGGLLLPVLLLLGTQGAFISRMGSYQLALADRTAYLDLYASHLRDVPWTGLGLGSFARFNPLMLGSAAPPRFWEFGAMHNVYLQWLYEGGWPGAALMFALVVWALGVIVWGLRRMEPSRRWPLAALGVSAMLALHGVVDFDLQIHAIAALWALVLGAGVGASLRRG